MAENQKPQISIKGVLDMLSNGKTRKEIGEHFGLTAGQIDQLFKHPQLKGRKTKVVKEKGFEIIEDAPDAPVAKYGPKKKKTTGEEATSQADTEQPQETAAQATGETQEEPVKPIAPSKQEKKIETQKGSW